MKTLTPVEIGFLAGIIEGEGCISADGNSVRVTVQMTDLDVVEKLARITDVGTVTGPRVFTDDPGKKPQWKWRVGNRRDVARVLLAVYPELGERRKAAVADAADRLLRNLGRGGRPRPECGVLGGSNAHRRRGESVCDACREFQNEYNRRRYADQRGGEVRPWQRAN